MDRQGAFPVQRRPPEMLKALAHDVKELRPQIHMRNKILKDIVLGGTFA